MGPIPGIETLRELARRQGLLIGTMARAANLRRPEEPEYRAILASEFSVMTAPCYFGTVQRHLGQFEFGDCDALYQFAAEHGLAVRGHTLVWSNALPPWLEGLSDDSLWSALRHHVSTVVSRYRGRTVAWDVVNEAVNPDSRVSGDVPFRQASLWFRRLGPTVYDSAFWWARRADSAAGLFYNDHSLEQSPEWGEAIYRFVSALKRRGTPVTGVGLQFHLRIETSLDTARIHRDLERLAELGLDIHITELDVLIGHSPPTAHELARQAELYRTVLRLCLDVSRCEAFVLWGFSDRRQSRSGVTWVDDPLAFDRRYAKKPAYFALWDELRHGR